MSADVTIENRFTVIIVIYEHYRTIYPLIPKYSSSKTTNSPIVSNLKSNLEN